MSKKFTSFWVLAAVVLLALPAQAQIAKRSAQAAQLKAQKALSVNDVKAAKAAMTKANEQVDGIEFRSVQAVDQQANQNRIQEEQTLKAADNTVGFPIAKWNWAAHQAPKFVPQVKLVAKGQLGDSHKTCIQLNALDGQKADGIRGPNRAATTDAHGIITAPDEGEEKYYTRTGTGYYVSNNSVYNEDQSGIVTIVEAEGGKVYIKDPVSHYSQGNWVEGTKDGNTITVAAGQPLAWNSDYSTTLGLYWGNVQSTSTGNTYIKDETGDPITFTVDDEAGTITLDGSSTDKIIAVFWDDNNSWSGYGDYGTVWTLNTEYEPASTDPIVLPDGAEVLDWYADGTGSAAVPTDVKVAFVGNEVYISGLTSNFPDAWIKGTLDGTTVTFSKLQFVGMYSATMPVWAVGADSQTGALQDFTMTYDAEAQTLTLDENQLLVFNAKEDVMYYLSYIESLTIYAEEPAPAQIDELPYINSFDDTADQKQFKIIDANEDGRTWSWYNGMARYTYHQTNQGDDWLVSPAIKLVAGKKYHFSIAAHAQTANYPERIEVKAAKENTAEALAAGTEVLPSTDVTTPGFVTYENNEFTVAESGYYYIGVHAISDADKYYLYVDDFVLEAAPITAPYVADFTTEAPFGDFVVIDNNEDGKTWSWNATNGAYYSYSSTNQADDYLVLPIKLEAGKNYKVTVNAKAYSANYPERFEVKVGKAATAEGLNITAIGSTDVASGDFEDYEGDFTATEDGIYYVAIHAISDADQWRLQVSSLSIEKGLEGTAPAAPVISAEAGAEGALTAAITVVAPSKTIDGADLAAANLTKVEILRDGEVIATETPAPGATINYTDSEVTTGNHTYQAIPYDANGDAGQKSEKVTVYVGEDELADVENVVAQATASTITFTWDAATGQNGGYVNAANVTYEVYALEIEQSYFGNYLVEGEVVATVQGATTATINYDTNSGKQQYLYFGVKATNAAGSTDATTNYTYVFVGAPDELPIEEGFAGKTLHYSWDSNGGLGTDANSSDDDGTALKLYNDGTSAEVFFVLPKVNLNTAGNPTILFDAKNGVNVDKIKVIGSADGADYQVLGEFNLTADYATIKQALASIKGTAYSSVGILATIPTASISQYEDYVLIDNIKIVDLYEYDLSVNVKAATTVQAGNIAGITATVKNEGENAASGYTVTIKAGEETLLSETVNEELAPFTTKEFVTELKTTIFDDAADVTIKAEVEYLNDLNEDNNAAETIVSIKEPTAAQPENVTAEQNGDNVEINWTAPENTNAEVTEDFAAYENGADEDGELGNWTLINANGKTKGGIFEDTALASDGLVRAWQVFNLATYGGDNSTFAGPDGNVDNNYLISVYNLEESSYPGNDDYLISPELPGIAQTLTFDVKAFNDYGAQTYQVLYSTTGKETADFQLIQEVADNGNAWNNVSYELPAGTKYFAIRNITGGDEGFILAVDNITYLAGGGDVTGFNIYANGEKIATVAGDVTTYTAALENLNLNDGDNVFAVSALYGENESKPVEVTISITGIQQIAADGKAVDVYTLDGKKVRSQAKSLNGLKGVFVIDGKAVMVK